MKLGESRPYIDVSKRTTEKKRLECLIEYAVFRSTVVLQEIASSCVIHGQFSVDLDLNLHVSALFISNFSIFVNVPLNISCVKD